MKANELRIGNVVAYKDKTVVVETITSDGVSALGHEREVFYL